jgi:hypothetical protein
MAISQSVSFENLGKVFFISLTIDFSSFASFSYSLLIWGWFRVERERDTMVLAVDMRDGVWDSVCDGVGDGDRDGVLALAALVLALMLGYLVGSFRLRPCAGRFQ